MEERAQLAVVALLQHLEPAAHGEQIGGEVRPSAEIETLECAAAREDGAAWLPERALGRAGFLLPHGVLQSADTGHVDRFSTEAGIGIRISPRR